MHCTCMAHVHLPSHIFQTSISSMGDSFDILAYNDLVTKVFPLYKGLF